MEEKVAVKADKKVKEEENGGTGNDKAAVTPADESDAYYERMSSKNVGPAEEITVNPRVQIRQQGA